MTEKVPKISKEIFSIAFITLLIITGCDSLSTDFGKFVDRQLDQMTAGSSDNDLISFSVMWGGREYFGAVSDNKIFVEFPSAADLTQPFTPKLIHTGKDYVPRGEKSFSHSTVEPVPYSIVSKNGKTRGYQVTIARTTITGLVVARPPSKTVYLPGERLVIKGIAVLGAYPGGNTTDITDDTPKYSISMMTAPTVPGTYTVTVASTLNPGASDTFTIMVAIRR